MMTVCIITKNEVVKLQRCLESLKTLQIEIVIVDTGSTDDTREMALEYTSQIFDFPWSEDFAAARNFAIMHASYDTIVMLDSDEYILELDSRLLTNLIHQNPDKVGRIVRKNLMEFNGESRTHVECINRIFSRQSYIYSGRIHEQLVRIDHQEYQTYRAPLTIGHDGYLGTDEQKKKKAERNISLMIQEMDKYGRDPYLLYQLGKSYYLQKEYQLSAEAFETALSFDLNPRLEYVVDMIETYGYALLNSGQAGKALSLENVYETFQDTSDFRMLMGLIYMNNEMFEAALAEFRKATESRITRVAGTESFLANYNAGVIQECLGKRSEAVELYRRCEGYEPAQSRLKMMGAE